MAILVFVAIKGGFVTLFDQAIATHADSQAIVERGYEASQIMEPGLQYGSSTTTKIDFISLGLSLVLGTAGLPHVLMRFYTVPTATEARRSVTWAICIIGAFYLITLVLGYGAAALVGPDRILDAPGGANAAAPLLALEVGGTVFLAIISQLHSQPFWLLFSVLLLPHLLRLLTTSTALSCVMVSLPRKSRFASPPSPWSSSVSHPSSLASSR